MHICLHHAGSLALHSSKGRSCSDQILPKISPQPNFFFLNMASLLFLPPPQINYNMN